MSDIIRLSSDAGPAFRRLRDARRLTAVKAAARAGKSRDTLYRFEAGADVSLGTLLSFLATVGCALEIVETGRPTLDEMRRRYSNDDDARTA